MSTRELCALTAFFGLCFALTPVAGLAEAPHQSQPAYDACAQLGHGDACKLTLGTRHEQGSCLPDGEDGSLFCSLGPARAPNPAIDACVAKEAGDSCTLDKTTSGTCIALRDDLLGCRANPSK